MNQQEIKAWMMNEFPQFTIIGDDVTSTVFRGVFDRDASNEMWKAVNKKTSEAGFRAYLNISGDEYRVLVIWKQGDQN